VPARDRVITTRYVTIDREAGKAYVTLNVYNGYLRLPQLDVIEDIKKAIANSTDFVEFIDKPNEIIQKDPIVMWSIINFPAEAVEKFSYVVNKILPEFSSYIYWPLHQLSLAETRIPYGINIALVSPLELAPGRSTLAPVTIENVENVSKNLTLTLSLLPEWTVQPEVIKYTLNPGEKNEFSFSIIVPRGVYPGYYVGRVIIDVDGGTVIKEYQFVVISFLEYLLRTLLIPLTLLVIAVSLYLLYALKHKEKRRREIEIRSKLEKLREGVLSNG